jgi:catechol 2,3-dioxygenase-like lactoylglutathione lyase family enzyme
MDLDHIVIDVTNLEKAIADYRDLGFTVSPGGEHADRQTHNALISFADSTYIELIAFRAGTTSSEHPWWRFAQAGGGFADWAIRTDAIVEHAERLRQAGLPIGMPRDGGRLRPDGVELRWRGTRQAPQTGLPFLIEDVTPRDLRVPGGAATSHANGVQGVAALVIAVADLTAAAAQYRQLLDTQPSAPAPNPLLAATTVELPCHSGQIVLAATPAGPIHERLQTHGPGPYALLLSTPGERIGWLPPELTHGAAIRLQPE